MHGRTRNTLVRWVLLASIALGVVVMHHVLTEAGTGHPAHAVAVSPTAGSLAGSHPTPAPDPGSDVLHRCMAIIQQPGPAVIVLLLLFVGVVAMVVVSRPRLGTAPVRSPARPPPGLAGRALLHSLCVARL